MKDVLGHSLTALSPTCSPWNCSSESKQFLAKVTRFATFETCTDRKNQCGCSTWFKRLLSQHQHSWCAPSAETLMHTTSTGSIQIQLRNQSVQYIIAIVCFKRKPWWNKRIPSESRSSSVLIAMVNFIFPFFLNSRVRVNARVLISRTRILFTSCESESFDNRLRCLRQRKSKTICVKKVLKVLDNETEMASLSSSDSSLARKKSKFCNE